LDVEPEEHFEGYTGNAGMTLDRWYRHAAIVVWPEQRHFEILCNRDSREAIPILKQMVARCRKASNNQPPPRKGQCVQLVGAILASWKDRRFSYGDGPDAASRDLMKALVSLGDPVSIGTLIGDVMARDPFADPGAAVVAACEKYGWSAFQEAL